MKQQKKFWSGLPTFMCPPAFKIRCRGDTSMIFFNTGIIHDSETRLNHQKSAKHMFWCTMRVGEKSTKLIIDKKPRKYGLAVAGFYMFSRHWSIRGGILYMWNLQNTIMGECIPRSLRLNFVFARNRLNSGYMSPAIFGPWDWVHQNFWKPRFQVNISRYRGNSEKKHNGIEFLTPVATWSGQNTWIVV